MNEIGLPTAIAGHGLRASILESQTIVWQGLPACSDGWVQYWFHASILRKDRQLCQPRVGWDGCWQAASDICPINKRQLCCLLLRLGRPVAIRCFPRRMLFCHKGSAYFQDTQDQMRNVNIIIEPKDPGRSRQENTTQQIEREVCTHGNPFGCAQFIVCKQAIQDSTGTQSHGYPGFRSASVEVKNPRCCNQQYTHQVIQIAMCFCWNKSHTMYFTGRGSRKYAMRPEYR